jgi:hypothetical protein
VIFFSVPQLSQKKSSSGIDTNPAQWDRLMSALLTGVNRSFPYADMNNQA